MRMWRNISNKQLLSTETQIRAEFNKLCRFLKEDWHLRVRKRSGRGRLSAQRWRWFWSRSHLCQTVSPLLKKTCRNLTCHGPDQSPGLAVRSHVAKHQGNLSFRVWEKMKEGIHFSPEVRCETWTRKAAATYATPEWCSLHRSGRCPGV